VHVERSAIDVVLLDIEGTTTPIAFVYDVLFPFARRHLREFLKDQWHTPAVADAILKLQLEWADEAARGEAPPPWASTGVRVVPASDILMAAAYLEWLMDRDRKSPALKLIQGLIWERGYASRELTSDLFPDVAPAIERWTGAGLRVAIYSSGSGLAQRLLFAHSREGDLTPRLSGFFDTSAGSKTEAASFTRIAAALATSPARVLFVSDVSQELDAARTAGCVTALCVRPGNPIQPAGVPVNIVRTFEEIAVV
jgi:enolase-phosphatase E1